MEIYPVSAATHHRDPDDFLREVWEIYDPNDVLSVEPMIAEFRAVANNREALLAKLEGELRTLATDKYSQYKQTSILLAGERSKRPYLRVNIWPTVSPDLPNYSELCKAYSYYFPHTHNFSFITTGYFGKGYETEIWKLLSLQDAATVGDEIDMEYQGRHALTNDVVMMYQASKDIHSQYPPSELSLSLNLMLYSPRDIYTTQLFVDVASKRIVGTSSQSPSYRRLTAVRIAEIIGDQRTDEILMHIVRRTRHEDLKHAAEGALIRRKDRSKPWSESA